MKQLDLQEIIESDSESEDYSELEVLFDENDDDLEDVVEATLEEPELDNEGIRRVSPQNRTPSTLPFF